MPCQVVNSQVGLQAQLPSLTATLPKTQSDWTSFLTSLRQWGTVLQQQPHAPNIIPPQFQTYQAAAATPVIAALTATNCTPSIDTGNLYYGTASLKVASLTNPATLRFTGTPIAIATGTRWYCSFQILAPSGCTGSLEVLTSGGHSVTESFTVAASSSWQQVWGLFDLTAFTDAQATWLFTFTSTSNFNIDGLQMNAVGNPLSFLPIFAGTQMIAGAAAYAANLDGVPDGSTYVRPLATAITSGQVDLAKAGVIGKTLTNVADASGRYAVTNAGSLNGVASVDGANLALIDFSQAGHTHKILDNIGDGTTYARYKAAGMTSGLADPSKSGLQAKGSVPPIILGCAFSWTTTSGQVVITWPAFTVYRPDGTTTSISSGAGTTVTGLTNGTVYTIYPYIVDGTTTVSFATGATGSAGSPAICYAGGSGPAAQLAYAFANIPLQSFTATPSAGGGGGGGDQIGCLHPSTIVELADGSRILADELQGQQLRGPCGPTAITFVSRKLCTEWVRVRFRRGGIATVTPDHRFLRPDDSQVRAADLHLGEVLAGRGMNVEVEALRLVKERAQMVAVNVEYPHLYYLAGALSHNGNPKP